MLITTANGSLLEMLINEIITILNKMTKINDHGESGRSLLKKQASAGIFEIDTASCMQAQMATMNQMLKALTVEKANKAPAYTLTAI